jgi:hypothetical protein
MSGPLESTLDAGSALDAARLPASPEERLAMSQTMTLFAPMIAALYTVEDEDEDEDEGDEDPGLDRP